MGLIPLLWCAFVVIVAVLAWVTLRLNRAVRKEVREREELMSQLSLLHDTDMASAATRSP